MMRLLRLLKFSEGHPRTQAAPSGGRPMAVVASLSPRPLPRGQMSRLTRKGSIEDDVLYRYLQGS